MAYLLHIGEKNYSSWSARPWILMRQAGIPFQEHLVSLREDTEKAARMARLPAGRVPVLEDDGLLVWDSLSIAEYLAERHPGLWPSDPKARAFARSMCAELHGGFQALRGGMSMDVRARRPQRKRTPELQADIARIEALWTEARRRFGQGPRTAGRSGPGASPSAHDMLFGSFTIADAYFAPVAFRFQTYGVEPAGEAGTYWRALLALPAVRAWEAEGRNDVKLADHDLDVLYPED
ncbi:MAG TPA: glutathione S-transferase family protein [Anaeromyxobacteraceae bacterium]|nr:glutathione S-transferase family protein [Anaeromyxobacteraceae bacterium]